MLVVLAIVALASLKPGITESVDPNLSVSPDIGAALDDAVAVAREPSHRRLAQAAVGDATRVILASRPGPANSGEDGPAAPLELTISRAEPVASGGPSPAPPAPSPQPQPTPEPAPAPVAVPVAEPPAPPAPGPIVAGVDDGSEEPGTAGVEEFGPIEVCDGDGYGVALLLYIESVLGEAEEETLAMHFAGEQGESTIYIEGASLGVLELVDQLLDEGECLTITVEVALPE